MSSDIISKRIRKILYHLNDLVLNVTIVPFYEDYVRCVEFIKKPFANKISLRQMHI